MNSIWSNLYDRFKDRRYGLLFFVTFVGFLVALLVGKVVFEEVGALEETPYFPAIWPGILILMVALIWKTYRRYGGKRERIKYPPMSRDELSKARSKLVKSKY